LLAVRRLVEKRDLEQWFLRTTAYADELLDFTGIDWPEPIKIQQTNWIGRSEGAEIDFEVAPDDYQPGGDRLRVFTTRPDTLFGCDLHGPSRPSTRWSRS
jgi:leucyl-tRNA synthetase